MFCRMSRISQRIEDYCILRIHGRVFLYILNKVIYIVFESCKFLWQESFNILFVVPGLSKDLKGTLKIYTILSVRTLQSMRTQLMKLGTFEWLQVFDGKFLRFCVWGLMLSEGGAHCHHPGGFHSI